MTFSRSLTGVSSLFYSNSKSHSEDREMLLWNTTRRIEAFFQMLKTQLVTFLTPQKFLPAETGRKISLPVHWKWKLNSLWFGRIRSTSHYKAMTFPHFLFTQPRPLCFLDCQSGFHLKCLNITVKRNALNAIISLKLICIIRHSSKTAFVAGHVHKDRPTNSLGKLITGKCAIVRTGRERVATTARNGIILG